MYYLVSSVGASCCIRLKLYFFLTLNLDDICLKGVNYTGVAFQINFGRSIINTFWNISLK